MLVLLEESIIQVQFLYTKKQTFYCQSTFSYLAKLEKLNKYKVSDLCTFT